MAGQVSIENGKKGGRPQGSLNKATLEKKEVEKAFTQRVLNAADRLFNAQLALAEGITQLYRIDEVGTGKDKRREHVLVTSPEEIKRFLDEHEGMDGEVDDNYYYLTTKAPDNKAIDSLLDRAFGKARQTIGLDGGEEGKPIPILATMNVPSNNGDQKNSPAPETDQGSTRGDISQQDNLDTPIIDGQSAVGPNPNPDERSFRVSAAPEEGGDAGLQADPPGTQVLEGQ